MKKLFSKLKKWSFFIFPMIVIAISYIVPCIKLFISNNSYKKVDTLMGCNATLIGFMIATLTIYLSFPKNESIMRRMKSSGHNAIILKNNIFGIIFYMLSLLVWLILDNSYLSVVFFMCAVSNTVIVTYYIVALSMIDRNN